MVLIYNKFFAQPSQMLFQHADFTNNTFTFTGLNALHDFLTFVMPSNAFSQILCMGIMHFNNNSAAGFMEFSAVIAGLANTASPFADILLNTQNNHTVTALAMGPLQAGGTVKLQGQQLSGANFGNGVSAAFLVWAIV